jgi:phage-related minor tail protein
MPQNNTDPKMTIAVEADTGKLNGQLQDVANQGVQLGHSLSKAFDSLIVKGQSFSDVLRSLALNLSKLALSSAFKPLEQSLNQGLSGIFNGGAGGIPFAKGGVTQGGMPVPFAAGGVISSPISFPLANGRTGIAGERGPEAIMPLTRGSDGRLGVATSGSGGGGVNVTFNVSTPDADSFKRSEAQLSALLSRAVSQGQRNL